MKSRLLCCDEDTLLGLSLAGISGDKVTEKEGFLHRLKALVEDETVGLVIVTPEAVDLAKEAFERLRQETDNTLFVVLRRGEQGDSLQERIRRAVGIEGRDRR